MTILPLYRIASDRELGLLYSYDISRNDGDNSQDDRSVKTNPLLTICGRYVAGGSTGEAAGEYLNCHSKSSTSVRRLRQVRGLRQLTESRLVGQVEQLKLDSVVTEPSQIVPLHGEKYTTLETFIKQYGASGQKELRSLKTVLPMYL